MREQTLEILDDPDVDPALRERSHKDVERSNVLFGGRRAVMLALRPLFEELARGAKTEKQKAATLLDVGTGLADLPWRAREIARRRGLDLRTVGVDGAFPLLRSARHRLTHAVCGDAVTHPFADGSEDIVLCSQLLHHFDGDEALLLIAELDRVARLRVIISDLRRSWLAAAGFSLAALTLRSHPSTRQGGRI